MKILIVSDTHGKDVNLKTVVEQTQPFDVLIHLGDIESSEAYIRSLVPCPVLMVRGNNDHLTDLPKEIETTLGKYKVLLTHGHYYYVSLNTDEICRQARAREFDIAMFGHTHRPYLKTKDDVLLLNPGSISYPRQPGHRPSYIWMEIGGDGKAHFDVRYL